jgi:hypothetical protein
MAHQVLIRLRLPLLLVTAIALLAASAVPAFAGEDGDDDATATPMPAQPTPIPVQPAPAPPQPAPAAPRPAPAPVVKAPVQKQTHKQRASVPSNQSRPVHSVQAVQPQTFVQRTPVAVQRVQAVRTVPRGGVQAGAGGTAVQPGTGAPLAFVVSGLILSLLAVGGGLHFAHVRSRP